MNTRGSRKPDPMEVCRACMSSNTKRRFRKPVPIFSKLNGVCIANIIADCSAVRIAENDALPTSICHECFETLKLLDAFVKTIRNSDRKLRKQLSKKKTASNSFDDDDDVNIKQEPLDVTEEGEEAKTADVTKDDTTLESDDMDPDNDNDSDWKGSDVEAQRTAKRKKAGLKSKPSPKKRKSLPVRRKPVQTNEDFQLNEEEQELFTVIDVPEKSHVCCGCLQVYSTAEQLEEHRKQNHVWKKEALRKPTSNLNCPGCLRKYDSLRSLNIHKDRFRAVRVIWECNKCSYRFKSAEKRRKHLEIHAKNDAVALIARFKETTKQEFGFICCAPKCGESFTTEAALIEHAQEAHWIEKQEADIEFADKPEQCQICFRRFDNKKKVMIHQRRLYKRKNFQCSLCGLKFATTVELNTHEVKDHNVELFKCEICDKSFSQKTGLSNHLKYMHSDEKNHKCNVCGMAFRQKGGLKVHMSNHVEVPQFKCEVCEKLFKAKLHLRYHMRTHTGERPYKCRYCDNCFSNHTNCRRHEMTHYADKPHKCTQCDRSFILKRLLIEHEKSHITGIQKRPGRKRQEDHITVHEEYAPEDEVIEIYQTVEDDDYDENESVEIIEEGYQEPISLGNRPVQIRLASEAAQQPPVRILNHTTGVGGAQLVANELVTPLNTTEDMPTNVAVYNVVSSNSSTGYNYILKFD